MSVCELEAGSPRYQVPRFHRTAARSSEKTMASPAPGPSETRRSTGRRCTIEKATTRPVAAACRTPTAFQIPDQTTAGPGRSERV